MNFMIFEGYPWLLINESCNEVLLCGYALRVRLKI